MRILVIGSGGREHALVAKLAHSPQVEKIFVAPGNPGTAKIAANIPIAADNITDLVGFAKTNFIDLVVPGPELPLTLGIADKMRKAGIACFGPDAYGARLEGSKSFAKEVMAKANVPTAGSHFFSDPQAAIDWLGSQTGQYVVKADGLAAGKGVVVCDNVEDARNAVKGMFLGQLLGKPVEGLLIEERLTGQEVSLICLCNGEDALPLPSAQDHKAVFDNDQGPNTGGMGAYSPAPVLPDDQLQAMTDLVIRPVLRELAKAGHPFHGALYAGLMLTPEGPKVLEYNVRFGDPECQAILPRMRDDLASCLMECANGRKLPEKIEFSPDAALNVVLTARGYPGPYAKNLPITGVENVDENVHVYIAGAKKQGGELVSNGGRVLSVTAMGENLADAQKNAYAALAKIRMPESHYRSDIGSKGIKASDNA